MQYATLARYFERLEGTTKRLEMTAILVELFEDVPADQLGKVAFLIQGKVAPDWEGVELGLAEKMILRALQDASGNADVLALYHEVGDLGLAAEKAMAAAGSKQASLFGPEPLTVLDVFDGLRHIAAVEGKDSQAKKLALLGKLLTDAQPLEARYIIRTVAGRARLGVADMTFLDALAAWHVGKGVRSVTEMEPEERAAHEAIRQSLEAAFDVRSDLAVVAHALATSGMDAVESLSSEHGVPLRPMAAERLKTLGEILAKHEGSTALEYKYDGLRVQCHVSADPNVPVRIFSRRLEELTAQFPDVQASLRAAFRGTTCIVEGECVAMDRETGAMRSFQEISRRRGRKTGLHVESVQTLSGDAGTRSVDGDITKEIPVTVFLFDCLASGGESQMERTYLERRAQIETEFALNEEVQLSTMSVCEDEAAMEAFFQRAVEDGAEGIMCKHPQHRYKAGNRGFDWIKYKTDYTEDLVDTMDLAVIGAFYGRGRRAGWYGALLMGAYNPDAQRWESVCKLGTGFDDATLMGLKEKFGHLESAQKPAEVDADMTPDVWLRPEVVMEVQAAEITLSPIHKAGWNRYRADSGIAARFPRFSGRWRDDKAANQATTVDELGAMYEMQTKR
ncbi:MAG: ATP-dependent DNA ligase [Thermoplasmatota archaeon]